ncbi:LysM peptidoglycan-binding domain-containing protein [Suttonella sp. R2A3]|uniref:LysM peptidoglycan-binding domain-containing protein n=1 Tax=Suttonella sp. R2A3 TaxID=2908648 RepID=UPI0038FC460E
MSNNQAFVQDHPNQYVVKKGDTLWDISGRFLHKPWYWKQIWHDNPQIKNPHLIYPGDVLSIVVINGQKYLSITEGNSGMHGEYTGRRTADGRPVVRYSPGVGGAPAEPSSLSANIIAPFVAKTQFVDEAIIDKLPVIFGNDEEYITLSQQQFFYTKGINPPQGERLGVYRVSKPVVDFNVEQAKTREERYDGPTIVGYQMQYIGEVGVLDSDPVTGLTKLKPLEVAQTMQEEDVLLPLDVSQRQVSYFPKLPSNQCQRGYILNNTESQTLSIKEFDSVTVSFGADDGAEIGDIWKIQSTGKVRSVKGEPVVIPGDDIGFLMIYKVYDKVSLGFVLDSTRGIKQSDYLVRP